MKIFNKILTASAVAAYGLVLFGTTTAFAAGPAAVNLLSAGNFTILAKTGITTTGTTSIVGDIGVSPAAATYITGFALTLPAASSFSTSALVSGKVYAPGYADPTPAMITTAISDMQTAYTDAMGRTNPTATELGAGNIGGMTLAPGLYKWGTGVTIPSDLTLSGSANDVWIFQIAQNLDISSGVKVVLSGGAQANNIFWVVAGQTTLGTTSVFKGNILDQTAIVMNTGAVLNGRALAQSQVTLDANTVYASPISTPAQPAIPATPATPATPTVSPAVPATPAVSAIPASPAAVASFEVLCKPGHLFSETTGQRCTGTIGTADQIICPAGHLFSETTGKRCTSNTAVSSAATATYTSPSSDVRGLKISLMVGSRSTSVETLQQYLIDQAKGPAAAALASNGKTMNFGKLTKAALAEWQKAVGIVPASGNFGPITRAYISSH
jgi:hypothetical protein